MGKIFITYELNDTFTASVTSGKMLRCDDSCNTFVRITSAHTLISGTSAASGGCFLRNIILGDPPATSTTLGVYDTSVCASNISAFGTSGANIIAIIGLNASAAVSGNPAQYPMNIPFNVYCTSGLTIAVGCSAADSATRIGALKNITAFYQT